MLKALTRLALCGALVAACGSKAASPSAKEDAGSASVKPSVAPLAMPVLGVDRPSRMNYLYGDGAAAFGKAVAAYNAKTRDWAAVRTNCEAALAKDPLELDAHWLLATALAQTGEPASAVDHIVAALAADYYRFGASLDTPDLADFRATPHGQAVVALATKIGDAYGAKVTSGVWVVARRSPFRWPGALGAQASSTRGELYAFDRESKRYFRLTHTDHEVAGFARAAGGGEVAVLGYDKIDRPKPPTPADAPPTFERAWIAVYDAKTWKPIGKRAALPQARELGIGYAAGDQLVATSAPAAGRWGLGPVTVASVDASGGKLAPIAGAAPVPRVALTVDEGRAVHDAGAADASATVATLMLGNAAVTIPESGQAQAQTIAIAPDKAHVAFATAVDACAKDVAASLYVADGKGALKHVLTAKSRFATRWLDATTLAYEDGDGNIRLWDAATGRETGKLEDKPGMALDALSPATAPLCKQGPALPPETVGSGAGSGASSDEPTVTDGPVTAPTPP